MTWPPRPFVWHLRIQVLPTAGEPSHDRSHVGESLGPKPAVKWACPLAVSLCLVSLPALSQSKRGVELDFDAGDVAARCPSQQAVEDAISARLGFSPFQRGANWLVEARISTTAAGLRGTIQLRDREGDPLGKREIDSSGDCEELVEAMAVGISVALEPLVPPPAPPMSEPVDEPKVEPAAPPSPTAVKPLPPRDEGVPTRTLWQGSLGVVGTDGMSPTPAFGIALQLSWRRPAWSVGVEGQVQLPKESDVEGGSIRTDRVSAWLVPCGHAGPWQGCALAGLGSLRAEGAEVDVPRTNQALFAAIGGRIGWEPELSEVLFLRVSADLAAALTRTTVTIDGQDQWTSSPVLLGVGAAIGGRL
jgi:hypothetical protein